MKKHKSIGYHTRLDSDNTQKIVGGSFGGSIDTETVDRLVNSHFSVFIKASGRPVFVDGQGREVSLYLSIDPGMTAVGREAIAKHAQASEQREKLAREKEKREAAEVQDLLENLTHAEIIERLTR
jgi:hypothetical protein